MKFRKTGRWKGKRLKISCRGKKQRLRFQIMRDDLTEAKPFPDWLRELNEQMNCSDTEQEAS